MLKYREFSRFNAQRLGNATMYLNPWICRVGFATNVEGTCLQICSLHVHFSHTYAHRAISMLGHTP